MNEYKIKWTRCPKAHNVPQVFFVKADSVAAAAAVADDHIQRAHGTDWFNMDEPKLYIRPAPGTGSVVS